MYTLCEMKKKSNCKLSSGHMCSENLNVVTLTHRINTPKRAFSHGIQVLAKWKVLVILASMLMPVQYYISMQEML